MREGRRLIDSFMIAATWQRRVRGEQEKTLESFVLDKKHFKIGTKFSKKPT